MTQVQRLYDERAAQIQQAYQDKLRHVETVRARFSDVIHQKMSAPLTSASTASASASGSALAGAANGGDDDGSLMKMISNMMMMQTMSSSWSGGEAGGATGMSGLMSMLLLSKLMEQLGGNQNAAAAPAPQSVVADTSDEQSDEEREPEPEIQSVESADETEPSELDEVSTPYDELIERAATRYSLSAALIKGVIQAESSFREHIVSNKGAQGLMQLMPDTARELGVTDPFDPEQNIMGGAAYLRKMLDRFSGDVKLALAAYNAGPNRVRSLGVDSSDDAGYTELSDRVRAYVDRVLRFAGLAAVG